ncbi:hypothetical protein ACFRAM_23250 [Paenibacillus sp. NPDC056722]|uniref:hypothetical protein n=1 Tax=Paenibacillus sp. NPDC056722 TaxID=3345924 RepID=UPI00369F0AD4
MISLILPVKNQNLFWLSRDGILSIMNVKSKQINVNAVLDIETGDYITKRFYERNGVVYLFSLDLNGDDLKNYPDELLSGDRQNSSFEFSENEIFVSTSDSHLSKYVISN